MHANTLMAVSLVLAALPGCKSSGVHASPDDIIQVNPESITIQGGSYGIVPEEGQPFYDIDGTGKLWFIEFAVLDEDLQPRNAIELSATSLFEGLAIIPPSAVRTVDPPELPEGIESRGDIVEACTDDEGNYTNDEEWCAYYYDVDSGTFVDFGSDYAYSEGYSPTYAELTTDSHGVARVYLFLDWIPQDGSGSYAQLETNVVGSIGYSSAVYALTFEAEKVDKE
jgi:hypothetical protein